MSIGRLVVPVLVVVSLGAIVNLNAASDWPRFRGPNGTGVANDRTIPVKWTDREILWKVPLPGLGNSSPVIWNGLLFVQSGTKEERVLLCLDAKDGSTKWVQSLKGKTTKDLHKKNNYASASPGVDADHVYAVFWDGAKLILNGYTHAGKELWSRDLGTWTSQHGSGASPIPIGGKVYFNNDQDTKAILLCLDGKTGNTLWADNRPHYRACYSSPFLRTLPDTNRPELVVVSTMGITGYDPDTGDKHWNWQWNFKQMQLRTTASPVYENGIIFACSGDSGPGGARHMVAVELGTSPKLLWDNRKDFPYVPTMLALGKHLYFINDVGLAGCYEAQSGKRVWAERLQGEFSSSPVLIDGKIYVANESGDVFVFAANPEHFEILAKNSLGEMIRATPAVADERLYIRGERHLFCIGKR